MSEAASFPSPILRLRSDSGLQAELNANGSLRRFDCGGIALALFVGNAVEGGPCNLYLRLRGGEGSQRSGRHAHPAEPRSQPPGLPSQPAAPRLQPPGPPSQPPESRSQPAGPPSQPAEPRSQPPQSIELLGPRSRTSFRLDPVTGGLVGSGEWLGIEYSIALVLARTATAWFWHVELTNTHAAPRELDLTYTHDVALAPYGAVRLNEFYVSQYLDHTPLLHPTRGTVVATRQNLAADGRHPWCLIGSLRRGSSFATDALQFHGLASRAGDKPRGLAGDLPGRRLQHEHALVTIRDIPLELEPQGTAVAGFFGSYVADHPGATSQSDLEPLAGVLELPEAAPVSVPRARPNATGAPPESATLFSTAPLLAARDLSADTLRTLFASQWRHEERDDDGNLLSFFHGAGRHVVLRAKELRVLRPHGHILRAGSHTTPDETALTSTVWMAGVFNSMLTQGHVNINRLLSTVHSYLTLFRSHGQRVFAEIGGTWHLLDVPSAFEIAPESCLWVYRYDGGVIQVRSTAGSDPHELTLSIAVTSGEPLRFLVCHHVSLDGDDGSVPGAAHWRREGGDIAIAPPPASDLAKRFPNGFFRLGAISGTEFERVTGDELLFLDGRSREQPYVCVVTARAAAVGLSIRGQLVPEASQPPLRAASAADLIPMPSVLAAPIADPIARIIDVVPWFTHNALVHYLSPRGLEQYSGGGWGTRDVCQGPVEMLFALGELEPIRDILLRVMKQQNPDGDWPQWFTFFDRERNIRAGDSHGDIVFWPLVVLAQYLIASGDAGVLEESVPFFDAKGPEAGERATVWQHTQRALSLIEQRVIPGTALAAYGHGDWNDSLQPADPAMRERMCSAWTVTLHFQMLTTLAQALRRVGRVSEVARLESQAERVHRDFQRLLVVNGTLAGYAVFDQGNDGPRYLLHPSDERTGVRYSSLAMIHAILEDMLTPGQTRDHLRLIEAHLSAPDGVRLFDKPMPYHGGVERLFQRAETATFFGREIGLMYTHAHLRYAQVLAHVGDAQRFFHALCQASPIGIRSIVPSATIRQANCYYSSSDAAFEDRYQASAEYGRVARGEIALDGGWRVYSSGAGIALGLILRRFLGLSCESEVLRVDPVIPQELDGLRVEMTLLRHRFEVSYRIKGPGCGVNDVSVNGHSLAFTRGVNPYRRGEAVMGRAALVEKLIEGRNELTIGIG